MINYKKYFSNPCKFEFMKKITTLIIACLLMGSFAKAQYVNIPDSNFRTFLINKYPACFNGAELMDTTCSGVVNEVNLDCIGDSIKDLSGMQYFKNLTTLTYENFNYLSSFPPLPNTLRALNLNNSAGITSLPALPNSLRALSCTNNVRLTSLPTLPDSLQVLTCESNSLLALPALPQSIKTLGCSSNNLVSLPVLPNSLISLVCTANHITQLQSNLPQTLVSLNIGSNPIASLPSLDSLYSLSYIDCSGDTNLQCLPRIPISVNYINFSGSGINCLPNYTTNVTLASTGLPLCTNSSPCALGDNYVNIPDNNFGQLLISKFPDCLHKDNAGLYWMDTTCAGVLTTDSLSTYYTMLEGSAVDTIRFEGLQYFKNLKYFHIQPMLHVSYAVIDNNVLPNGIKTLQFGSFNAVIFNTSKLPDSLINFTNNSCNQFLGSNVVFPSGFKNFSFSGTRSIGDWINGNTFPDNLETFVVRYLINYSPLTNLPNNLKTFEFNSCWGVTDFSYMNLPAGLQNLSFIDANRNVNTNAITLPKLPASLKTLNLNSTKTSCLPLLPDSLQTLDITGASVSCISKIPNAYLSITPSTPLCNATNDSNSCTVVTKNYVNIPDSNFRKYLITQIPTCFNVAGQMDTTCSGVLNEIKLDCSNQLINDLSGLQYFKNLFTLICSSNNLKVLSNLPSGLGHLECMADQLSDLPTLPTGLVYLNCANNHIITLPALPNTLIELDLDYNPITSLPYLEPLTSLFKLSCIDDSNLVCLPKIPNSLQVLYPGPNIKCLPNYTTYVNGFSTQLLLCNISYSCSVSNSFVNIPDSNFRNYLISQIPACFNGEKQLDTTCSGMDSLKVISCGNLNITDLTGVSYFKNLDTLNCNNNLLTTIPPIAKTIKVLFASYNQLTSLPTSLPDSLHVLLCNNNKLTSLPSLPAKLNYLSCEYNQLTSLVDIPETVGILLCNNNKLDYIQKIPGSIAIFTCDNNQLTFLPPFPATDSTKGHNCYFSATGNKNLTCLPKLPNNFRTVRLDSTGITCLPNALDSAIITPVGLSVCSFSSPCFVLTIQNNFVNIPDSNFAKYLIKEYPNCLYKDSSNKFWMDTICSEALPKATIHCNGLNIHSISGVQYFTNLSSLNCSNNPLGSLPTLSNSLTELLCSSDSLTALPTLPTSLNYLNCQVNNLTTLGTLPNSLLEVNCRINNISNLPLLPTSLLILRCDGNPISSLPTLPNGLKDLYINTTDIHCLPVLPESLANLTLDTNITHCMPNQVAGLNIVQFNANGSATTGIALATCNPTNNANQCKPYPTVMGKVFGDDNSNGIKDSNEHYIPYVPVKLNTGAIVYTDNAGQYTISTSDTGSFSLSVTAPPNYKVLPTNTNFSFSANNSFLTLSDIALQPTTIIDSLAINIESWNVAVPGRSVAYSIDYRNMGTNTTGATISFIYDTSKLIFDSASIPSVTKNGNTLTWSDTLTPNYFGSRFYNNGYSYPYFTFTVKPSVHLGDSINSVANIASAKATATNGNTLIARSSFDPNSKEATLQLSTKQVMDGEMIDYHVHFQNIGNASARNIVIADTLSPLLTQGLLQMMGSSHNPNITFKNNIIYFEFLNIELPDSGTNQLKSNGFVHFKLKPVTTLSEGTNIENKASIYFDYNSPVITNITSTIIKNTPLPVSLRSYTAQEVLGSNGQIANNWTAANELNVAFYNVQRSADATSFSNIGQVAAKGNGGYSFLDLNAGLYAKYKTLYYRLQIIDKDGSIRYSKTISVELTVNRLPLTVFPNPSKSFIIVNGKGITEIRLIDNLGRVVLKRTSLNVNDAQQRLDFKLGTGIYMAKILFADGTVKSEKVVVE